MNNSNPKDYRKIDGNTNPEEVELEIENLNLEDANFKTDFSANIKANTSSSGNSNNDEVENLDINDAPSNNSSTSSNEIESPSSDMSSDSLNDSKTDSKTNEDDLGKKSGEDSDDKKEKMSDSNEDSNNNKDDLNISEAGNENVKDGASAKEDEKALKEEDKEDKSDSKDSKEEPSRGGNLEDKKDEKNESPSEKKEDSTEKESSGSGEKKSLSDRASEKANELKDKAQDKWDNSAAKEKLDKAKEFAKDPKGFTKNAARDRFNNSRVGQGINKAKNFKKNPKEALRGAAKDKFDNSKLGQGIQKGKDAVDKAKKTADKAKKAAQTAKKGAKAAGRAAKGLWHLIVSTSPWSWIVIGAIILLFLLIVLIMAIAGADGRNDVNSTREEQNYSEKDLDTLNKLRQLYEKYPNADAALSMVTVIYPYYETLIDTSILSKLKDYDPTKFEDYVDEKDANDPDDSATDDEQENTTTCDGENCDKNLEDDMYLTLYREPYYRNQFKKLLKKSNKMKAEEFDDYILNKYMKKTKGYKNLLAGLTDDEKEEIKKEILDDLKMHSEYFKSYIYEKAICSSSSTSMGHSYAMDDIDGPIYVVLKDTKSGDFSTIKNAPSLYGTENLNLDLKRYTLGVVYAEIGSGVTNEAYAKTFIISAKSLVLGRTAPGGSVLSGMGYKYEKIDDKVVFYMRANTGDQDFCDIYEGCKSGTYSKSLGSTTETNNLKDALSEVDRLNLERWYDEVAGEFVYDDVGKGFHSNYCTDYNVCSYCKVGNCISQKAAERLANEGRDYQYILYTAMYSDSKYASFDMQTSTVSTVTGNCTNVTAGGCTIPDEQFIYYSQRLYDNAFCGRSDGTIKSSGCGVTSMAMILANLVDPVHTPLTTMPEAQEGGYCGAGISGTDSGFFKAEAEKYGLAYSTVSADSKTDEAHKKIKDTLSSGGLIIANVGAGWDKVTSGHYLVIKGITADEKLIIADPMVYPSEVGGTLLDALRKPFANMITISQMEGYMAGRLFHLFTGGKSEEIRQTYCRAGGKGYLGNPLDPSDTSHNFMEDTNSNASCFPRYCQSKSPHGGIDLSYVAEGTAVYAMDSGIVSSVGNYSGNCYPNCPVGKSYGINVTIDHQNGYKTIYAHFSKRVVNKGDEVQKGQLIGYSGNTGNSTGAHLHLELQKTDLLNANGREAAKASEGKGLINPAKYINSTESYVGKTQ